MNFDQLPEDCLPPHLSLETYAGGLDAELLVVRADAAKRRIADDYEIAAFEPPMDLKDRARVIGVLCGFDDIASIKAIENALVVGNQIISSQDIDLGLAIYGLAQILPGDQYYNRAKFRSSAESYLSKRPNLDKLIAAFESNVEGFKDCGELGGMTVAVVCMVAERYRGKKYFSEIVNETIREIPVTMDDVSYEEYISRNREAVYIAACTPLMERLDEFDVDAVILRDTVNESKIRIEDSRTDNLPSPEEINEYLMNLNKSWDELAKMLINPANTQFTCNEKEEMLQQLTHNNLLNGTSGYCRAEKKFVLTKSAENGCSQPDCCMLLGEEHDDKKNNMLKPKDHKSKPAN